MPGTEITDIDGAEAIRRQREGAVLVDVREEDEWTAGHAPDAVHVPLGVLGEDLSQFNGKSVLTVCRSGGRSTQAAKALDQAGIDVANIAGGMSAWAASGLPVVRDDGSTGTVI